MALEGRSYRRTEKAEKVALKPALEEVIRNFSDEANIGIEVISLKNENIVYQKNNNQYFIPASCVKIITALAAFDLLGVDFHFKTEIRKKGENLYFKGSGDPTLSISDLEKLVAQIRRSDVSEVGDLVLDLSEFDTLTMGPGWMWDEGANDWNPPITALTVERNCVDVWIKPARYASLPPAIYIEPKTMVIDVENKAITTSNPDIGDKIKVERRWMTHENKIDIKGFVPLGASCEKYTVSIEEPENYVGAIFKELLIKQGIAFKGKIIQGRVPIDAQLLISHSSKPLHLIVQKVLKESDNLYAECLFKKLGAIQCEPPGNWQKGGKAVRDFLEKKLHFKSNDFVILDGSGLSRYNLFSPHQMVTLLKWAHEQFTFSHEFKSSLAISGVDGTLEDYLNSSDLKGKIKAKTGVMTGIASLSGYLMTEKGEELAFSIMCNGFVKSQKEIKQLEEAICTLLIKHY